jgi:PAS domain S-box-containing protein
MTSLKEYYEGFFNNSVDAILVINDNSFIHVNDAAIKMFGYSHTEFKDLHPGKISPEFQEDGEDSVKKIEWMILLAIKNGHNRFEWIYTKKDGVEFYCEVLLIPVIEKTINVYAVVRDISEKKTREFEIKKLNEDRSFILENIDVFLYRYNRQGIFEYISPSIKSITGYEEYEWKESYLRYLSNSPINNDIDKNIAIVLSEKKKVNYNVEIYKKNGERVILNLDEKPYFNEHNELDGVLGVAKDITEDLKSQGAIYYAQKMETLSNLASGFTHEVNNSLAILKGNIGIIKNKLSDLNVFEEVSERFSFVDQSMNRILKMLEKILILSKKYDNKKQEIDLNELILGITEDLEKVFIKNVNIEINLQEEQCLIYASHYHITQLFLSMLVHSYNLITLIKESKKTQVGKIKVSLKKISLNNVDYWEIKICDNSTEKGGNLNVNSLRKIVEMENGKLHIEFEEGNIFKIYLPLHKKIIKEAECVDLLSYKANGETIFIIDDELLIVKTASEILKNFGFNVIYSLNGIDGLKIYKKNISEISLVIIDMDMPIMDGRELFYKLKELNEDIKIIVSSGYRDDKRVLELVSNKDVGFIPKPYSVKLFLKEIHKFLKS